MQKLFFKLYIVLAAIFSVMLVVFVITGPKEVAQILFLGLAWSLFGILINSGYFTKRKKE